MKPSGFHLSRFSISFGPISSFLYSAPAKADNIAAFMLQRLIPPLPSRSRKPRNIDIKPSRKKASVGLKFLYDENAKILRKYRVTVMMTAAAKMIKRLSEVFSFSIVVYLERHLNDVQVKRY